MLTALINIFLLIACSLKAKWMGCSKDGWVSLIACCLVIVFIAAPAYASVLTLKLTAHHQNSTWDFKLTSQYPLSYRATALEDPKRLVLDLNTRNKLTNQVAFNLMSPVKAIRYARKENDKVRVVFDLKAAVDLKNIIIMLPENESQKRAKHLTVRIPSIAVKARLRAAPSRPVIAARSKSAALHRQRSAHATAPFARQLIVVIDPGHGGIDPGATGKDNTHEKNIVLSISKKLQKEINKEPGFKALLTRKGDYYLKLRQRLAIARQDHADMFIAVHADTFNNARAHGVSVFALSTRGATSEAARWIAAKENKSESLGDVKLNNKSQTLRSILIDLSQKATTATSIRVGDDIIKKIKPYAHLHQNHVEQAAFVVLKSPDIPSLLIEVGFLSNAQEERRLKSERHQQRIAKAISLGVVRYFKHRPPPHTLLAQSKKEGYMIYTVQPGDSLSRISHRFHVTVKKIKIMNHKGEGALLAGSHLKIPQVG